ncbi:T9SS C-terminal target domain-containing protein [Dokdonia sinensis]|uniref:T9SS C-terminal target domain-containing protein n=1 Tax=Dokdonia sinensis TaxID=2479847 RepID=A0A3M0H397_9FLAO|nr:T9SS type A sorting domain-containing protein [Dokdonia sinensis]RMB64166.1 T9SS C-terminal target domain-containing protein [Dokdonia sinensis]
MIATTIRLTLIFLCFAANSIQAQTFERIQAPPPFPQITNEFSSNFSGTINAFDADNDGDEDVFITGSMDNGDRIAELHLNDGIGNYVIQEMTIFEGISTSAVAIADVDGDNDLDIIATGLNSSFMPSTKLYLNDGMGSFTEDSQNSIDPVRSGSVNFFDIDGDGDQDILITGLSSGGNISKIYSNNGTGIFTELSTSSLESVILGSVDVADVDGDNDIDFVLSGRNAASQAITKLYKNNGVGVFTEDVTNPLVGAKEGDIKFIDINNTGIPSLYINGADNDDDPLNILYDNDGFGNFTPSSTQPFNLQIEINSLAMADVNGDNLVDVLTTGTRFGITSLVSLYLNDGAGGFTEDTTNQFIGASDGDITFSDIDDDGDQDFLISGRASRSPISTIYVNDSTASFIEASQSTFPTIKGNVEVAIFKDIDNDSDEDLYVMSGRQSKLFFNDGTGEFSEAVGTTIRGLLLSAAAFADVDGDLDQDLIISGSTDPNALNRFTELYINDGLGNYTLNTSNSFPNIARSAVAFGDIDGDLDQDLIISGTERLPGQSTQIILSLFKNDGNGIFTEVSGTPIVPVSQGKIDFADFDGDTDLDLLITGNTAITGSLVRETHIYTNDGTGNFSDTINPAFEGIQGYQAVGDLDGDLDLDVILTGLNSSREAISEIYLNDGSALFSQITPSPFSDVSRGPAIGDVDSNGTNDIIISFATSDGEFVDILLNDGNANFVPVPERQFVGAINGVNLVEDIDNDNDLDVFISGFNNNSGEIVNLYRNTTLLNTAPTASCKNITAQLDSNGLITILPEDVDDGSSDAEGTVTLSLDITDFTCSDIGTPITVTLTVEDQEGLTDSCTATVTVQDNVAPTAICSNITVQLDDTGNASITAADIDNGSNDACGIDSIAIDTTSFTCADVGDNTVTLTVTDNNGNVADCMATVTVEDNVAPTAICSNITVQLDDTGNATITAAQIDNGSNDACGIDSIAIDTTSFTCADVGDNTVTLTVTDNNGNVADCMATVTVEDNVAPTAICSNITVQLDDTGNATITAAQIDNGSNDACGIDSIAIDTTSFTCADVGDNTVTLTVTDNNGNVADCMATVTVEDNVAPTAICSNITVQLDNTGNATITAAQIDNGSNDACGIDTIAIDTTSFTCADVGDNTVILTVTDNNGNVADCMATVTVEDNVAPTAICSNITVQLNDTGNATITAAQIDNGSNDACGINTIAIDTTSFTCADVGDNTVTLTVTDNNGNVADCMATVTVQDNVAPTAICSNITVQLDDTGNATITAADVDNGSNDACGIDSIAIDTTSFTCADVGDNTVTLTITDNNGNVADCVAVVTILGEDPITIVSGPTDIFTGTGPNDNNCSSLVVYDEVTIDSFVIENNCGSATISSVTQSGGLGSGSMFPVGTTTEEFTLTDSNGNTTIYTFEITITDTSLPTLECPEQDLVAMMNDEGVYLVEDFSIFASDNCSQGDNLEVIQTPAQGTVVNENGIIEVDLIVFDEAGNTTTCTFNVIVDDLLGLESSVISPEITVYPNPTLNLVTVEASVVIDNISVFDLRGRELIQLESSTLKSILDLSSLSTGAYLIKIQSGSHSTIKRVIKQ